MRHSLLARTTSYAALGLAALLTLVASGTARADSKEDLLKKVGKSLDSAYSNRDPQSPYNDSTLAKLRSSSAACLKAIDAALAGGATLDDEVEIPSKEVGKGRQVKNKLGFWISVAPMRDGQAYCQSLAARPALLELEYVLTQADGWLAKSKKVLAEASAKPGLDNQARAETSGMNTQLEPCKGAVSKALAAGVAATATVKLKNLGVIALADAQVKVCDALAAGAQAILAVEDAKLEKMLAPYKAVLKGERLSTFLDRQMIFDAVYGKGAKQLDTPAKLASAPAWFIVMTGDVGLGFKSVTVRRYLWSGNKLKSVEQRTGCCT